MKIITIALKDLWHSFRSAFALVFMFVIPALTVGLFFFAFGGAGSGEGGFNLPTTEVVIVNQDQPAGERDGFSAGTILVDLFDSEDLAEIIQVQQMDSASAAREAVDNQQAGVAVIIPANFTTALTAADGETSVEVYQDPTLTIGPGIVRNILSQFIDGFAGSKIAAEISAQQLQEAGLEVTERMLREISLEYARWSTELGQNHEEGNFGYLDIQVPEQEGESEDLMTIILRPIMIGMMIFYAFFTGANSARSILDEEDAGTLQRLFTTPSSIPTILGGKFLAVFLTIFIQVSVLLSIAFLVFDLAWGDPLALILVLLGLVLLASSFGIFLTSLLKHSEQIGVIFGGALTVTGMVGVNPMYTGNLPGTREGLPVADVIALLTPQGWAMRGWSFVILGKDLGEILITAGVMLLLSVLFFLVGTRNFRNRYAR